MVQRFNYAQEEDRLNITQKQGIIKVLPKKKKDRLYLEHWRPVTLLNVDYKLATKLIAYRVAKILPKLTGYVKGRYIGQNIRLIKGRSETNGFGTNSWNFYIFRFQKSL